MKIKVKRQATEEKRSILTRQDMLLEYFPNVKTLVDIGVVDICPHSVDQNLLSTVQCRDSCKDCLVEYWFTPVEYLEATKIKVSELDIIVTSSVIKPYYQIKYRTLDGEYHIGYGSYSLSYVIGWKNEFFEIVEE